MSENRSRRDGTLDNNENDNPENDTSQQAPASSITTTSTSQQVAAGQRVEETKEHPLQRIFRLLKNSPFLVMNAAVTIFGLGVGVGLILGDSLRNISSSQDEVIVAEGENNDATTPPSCGAATNRTTTPETPPSSTSAALLPAQ